MSSRIANLEQTNDLAEAEKKLSTVENCFSGLAYRLYRTDWYQQ